jgi:hypothetical protein
MRREFWLAALMAMLCACGSAPPEEHPQSAPAPAAPKPMDEGRRFPMADRVSVHLVDDHVLGKDYLPGGNVAEYRRKGRTYQEFLVHSQSAKAAALLLFDFKGHLREAKYLAHMGGYFGIDGTTPVYMFQKGVFLAGLLGLPEKEADPLARQFAARLD